jgi:serine/threonine-protein kinase
MTAVPPEVAAALADRYAIERELGQGGMATVYLAEDLKHQRKVAIKVLRRELAAVLGADRFVQEIRTTANLQHPNILPLFDSGEASGFLYYVMPYVAGETLREKLNREKQLSIPEAVRITTEVAEALDYAHRHEVIHRDIKPENILLHDGRPMVADFGIALAVSAAAGGRMTETGLSLGTPHYMSPEQATAEKDITRRSDIYSLGAVLYEMLSGDPPHTGSSAQQIIMRIITEEPRPVTTLRHTVPPHVAAAVAKAIEKLPADRFASAREFCEALVDPGFTHAVEFGGTRATSSPARSAFGPWMNDRRSKVAAGLVAVLGISLAWVALSPRPEGDAIADRPVYRFVLLDSTELLWPVVAPDGSTWIATPTGAGSNLRFRVRRPGATEWSEITTTDVSGAAIFAVSPDGQRVAFARSVAAGTEIRTFSAESREETLLATLSGRGFAFVTEWSEGFIYVTAFTSTNLIGSLNLRVPETGGARVDTIPLPAQEGRAALSMKTIPGSDVVLYTEVVPGGAIGATNGRILAFRPRTRESLFVADGIITAWSPTGHVLVGREGGFVDAVAFDPNAFRVTGPPRQVLAGAAGTGLVINFAGSRAGSLAYFSGSVRDNSESQFELRWRGLNDTSERIPMPATDHDDAAVSPDGSRIAYVRQGRIWVYNTRSGRDAPLSSDTLRSDDHDPDWSPDGRRLVFSSIGAGTDGADLYVQAADGSAPAVRVGGTPGFDVTPQWLSDSTIIFVAEKPTQARRRGQGDIYSVVVGRPGSERALLESPFGEHHPRVDPSGRWLLYRSRQDSIPTLYVRRYPTLENPVRVASDSGLETPVQGRAAWSADGRSVLYVSARDSLIRVTLDLSGAQARVVSRSALLWLGRGHVGITDRHPTDGRLLQWVHVGAEAAPRPTKLVLIANFDREIRRIMGEGR